MNTLEYILLLITMLLFFSSATILACDTTPTETASNVQYAGNGLYTIDIQNCIGNAGSSNGFTMSTSDVNIVGFSPDTIQNSLNNKIATGTLNNGIVNYAYSGSGYFADFVDTGQNIACFSTTITVDAYPESSIVTFTGVNSPGGCAILGGDTQTTPVLLNPTCGTTFYDTGGLNNPYGYNEDYALVICGGVGPVTITFSEFSLAQDGDIMTIYDNDSISGLSQFFTADNSPGTVTSTNSSNCLAVAFESNSFGNVASGWVAEVICPMPCPNDLSVEALNDTLTSGFNTPDGTVSVSVSGGSIPYTFAWNTGDNTDNVQQLVPDTYYVTVTDANGCIAIDSTLLTSEREDSIVSVTHPENCDTDFEDCLSDYLAKVEVYPNPMQDQLNITFETNNNKESIKVQLIDVLGRTLKENTITPDTGSNKTIIDTSDLTTAMYFIVIGDGKQQATKKILKR